MHICTFLNPHTLGNKFEGAFNDFPRLHRPISSEMSLKWNPVLQATTLLKKRHINAY